MIDSVVPTKYWRKSWRVFLLISSYVMSGSRSGVDAGPV
jgi:hypothetical protein